MEDKRKLLKMRLIMSIINPILVLIITGTMLGITFAWFSASAVPQTATITLETNKIFELSFTTGNGSKAYKGQTALDFEGKNGALVTTAPASESTPNNYPFVLDSTINISTEGLSKAVELKINQVFITVDSVTKNLDRSNADYAPYGFTWYFMDKSDTFMYTPYGTIRYNKAGSTYESEKNILKTTGETYTFYLVFAPERLYWLQKFYEYKIPAGAIKDLSGNVITPGHWEYTNTTVYTLEEQAKIVDSDFPYQVYYSVDSYIGCKFEFNMEMVARDPE